MQFVWLQKIAHAKCEQTLAENFCVLVTFIIVIDYLQLQKLLFLSLSDSLRSQTIQALINSRNEILCMWSLVLIDLSGRHV